MSTTYYYKFHVLRFFCALKLKERKKSVYKNKVTLPMGKPSSPTFDLNKASGVYFLFFISVQTWARLWGRIKEACPSDLPSLSLIAKIVSLPLTSPSSLTERHRRGGNAIWKRNWSGAKNASRLKWVLAPDESTRGNGERKEYWEHCPMLTWTRIRQRKIAPVKKQFCYKAV